MPQGISAELIAEKWGFTREELDAFALESQPRAARATAEARFDRELVPVPIVVDGSRAPMTADEGIRPDTTAERLAALKPAFKPDGVVTAGNSSQISDGAAAVLITSEEAAARLGLTPRARFVQFALAGDDPDPDAHRADPGDRRGSSSAPASRSTTSTGSRSTRRSPASCSPGRTRCSPTWTGST